MKWGGNRFVYSTRRTLPASDIKYWDDNTKRIKDCKQTRESRTQSFNEHLHRLETKALDTWHEEQKKGPLPSVSSIKDALDRLIGREVKEEKFQSESFAGLITKFATGKIERRGKKLAPNTVASYKQLQNQLNAFRSNLNFEDITVPFWTSFKTHMERKGLGPNSIQTNCKNLKAVMRYANENGYTTNADFKNSDFFASGAKTVSTYLNTDEIELLRTKGGSSVSLDYFLLACETGARISDWDKFNPAHIKKEKDGVWFFTYTAQKTGIEVTVKCSDLFLEIYRDKYKCKMPPLSGRTAVSRHISNACKAAGLKPRTPHEARRSFCTNLFIKQMNVRLIMTMSGHLTEESFRKYLKLGPVESAQLQREFAERKVVPVLQKVG